MEVTFDGGRMIKLQEQIRPGGSPERTVIHRSQFSANLSDKMRDGTVGDEVEIILSGEFVKD